MLLVTGATGHIGNVLVQELVKQAEPVRVFVLPGEDPLSISGLPVEIVYGDMRNYTSLLEAINGITRVYHLAGIVSIGLGNKKLLNEVNVGGTKNMLKACKEKGIQRLVYTSSIHAFTELPAGEALTETKDFNFNKVVGNYGRSKAMATAAVMEAAAQGMDVVIVHPTGVIGPYEYSLSHMGQLVLDYLHHRLFAYINGSYDFVDVRDVAHGIILAMAKGRKGENYILSGEQVSVKQILGYLEDATGIQAPRLRIPLWFARLTAPLSELYYQVLRQKPLYTSYSIHTLSCNSLTSHQKATEELGYQSRPVRESIFDAVEWIRKIEG